MRIDTPAIPPSWATAVGLNEAREGESLRQYAKRIGFAPPEVDALFAELTSRTAEMANNRLAHRLRKMMPAAWQTYYDARVTSQLTSEQRQRIAHNRWVNSWL